MRTFQRIFGFLISFSVFAGDVSKEEYSAIAERIKPVGSVYSKEETAVIRIAALRDGATIYGTFCFICHGAGVGGAPKIGNANDWIPRIAQGKDVMKNNAIKGIGAMPPRGACMNCSDDEIAAAIEHMITGL
ncbi:cytochrome c5 [Candidatus Photodesmus blepharus]|uniref:Cytochrome c5 n=1 Tax=Candidatus Photodesmus blepharonis TaxID=1179155 RepID=A0A084CNR2_9GAMM|nr:cytochrome c5 family protein [Candidatus Photodesmus blepharus]KEY91441.1 cytochrome c5 [Candidatus Photodesmus blepharus]